MTLYRFLKDTVFAEDDTVERLIETIQWRKELRVSRMTYQSIASEFFEEGFAFFHKQDILGRPVAIIQMRHFPKFKDKTKSLSEFMQPFACLVMEIARQLTRDLTRKNEFDGVTPELISQISIIIDIAKAPFVPVDSNLMHALKDIVNLRFPGFVGSVYIMNFGWMYQGIWQVVKLVLTEQAKARVNFISNEEVKQVIAEEDLLTGRNDQAFAIINKINPLQIVLGGKDDYQWSLDSDLILNIYATKTRFESIQSPALSARISRSSSVSSFTSTGSSVFYDAPEFISRQNSAQYEIIRSTYTSACPSIYGTPGTLTPINSHLTNRQQQQVVVAPSEPRYFLNGFHMGDSFLTSFFRLGSNPQTNQGTLDGHDLTKRLNELISAEEIEQLSEKDTQDVLYVINNRQAHFPHMLPDNHPQSIYANAPLKHHLVRAEQKMMRLTRKLFHLSFAHKGALYWLLIYLLVRGPVEHSIKKALQKVLAGTTQQQIAYTTIGVTATIAAALSASLSNSLQTNNHHNSNNKRNRSSSRSGTTAR